MVRDKSMLHVSTNTRLCTGAADAVGVCVLVARGVPADDVADRGHVEVKVF